MFSPVLCWNDKEPTEEWQPSPGNYYWRPRGHRYPDSRQLKPGDIILFKPTSPTISQKLIKQFQSGVGYTHAALYLDRDSILCEATPKYGVAFSELETKLKRACILVRRVPGIGDNDRQRMALAASNLRGQPYSFKQIFEKAIARFRTQRPRPSRADFRGVICSTLCEHALLEGTLGQVKIREYSDQVVTPADLASSQKLVNVEIEWRKNVPAHNPPKSLSA